MTDFHSQLMLWINNRPHTHKTISKSSLNLFEPLNLFEVIDQFTADMHESAFTAKEINQIIDYTLAGMENHPDPQAQYRILVLIQSYYSLQLNVCGNCGELTPRVLCYNCTNPK